MTKIIDPVVRLEAEIRDFPEMRDDRDLRFTPERLEATYRPVDGRLQIWHIMISGRAVRADGSIGIAIRRAVWTRWENGRHAAGIDRAPEWALLYVRAFTPRPTHDLLMVN